VKEKFNNFLKEQGKKALHSRKS